MRGNNILVDDQDQRVSNLDEGDDGGFRGRRGLGGHGIAYFFWLIPAASTDICLAPARRLGIRGKWPSRRHSHCICRSCVPGAPPAARGSDRVASRVRGLGKAVSSDLVSRPLQAMGLEDACCFFHHDIARIYALRCQRWNQGGAGLSPRLYARRRYDKRRQVFYALPGAQDVGQRLFPGSGFFRVRVLRCFGRIILVAAQARTDRERFHCVGARACRGVHSAALTAVSMVLYVADPFSMFRSGNLAFLSDSRLFCPLWLVVKWRTWSAAHRKLCFVPAGRCYRRVQKLASPRDAAPTSAPLISGPGRISGSSRLLEPHASTRQSCDPPAPAS